jgi:hypothetical protein
MNKYYVIYGDIFKEEKTLADAQTRVETIAKAYQINKNLIRVIYGKESFKHVVLDKPVQSGVEYLKERYRLEPNDLDLNGDEDIEEVERLATKLGLTPIDKMTIEKANNVLNRFKVPGSLGTSNPR